MQTENAVQLLIDKVQSGKLDQHLNVLDGTEFGIFIPTYAEDGVVKIMMSGYSQTEQNLVVSVSRKDDPALASALPVAWMNADTGKDSTCRHGNESSCRHCTIHDARCRHCSAHPIASAPSAFDAPALDYERSVGKLADKEALLKALAKENFGLTLLHSHNDKSMFAHLPAGYVAVIADGMTTFRKEDEVKNDSTFVPNTWRSIDRQWWIAGGYSGSRQP